MNKIYEMSKTMKKLNNKLVISNKFINEIKNIYSGKDDLESRLLEAIKIQEKCHQKIFDRLFKEFPELKKIAHFTFFMMRSGKVVITTPSIFYRIKKILSLK